jgi:hypothetical protein
MGILIFATTCCDQLRKIVFPMEVDRSDDGGTRRCFRILGMSLEPATLYQADLLTGAEKERLLQWWWQCYDRARQPAFSHSRRPPS